MVNNIIHLRIKSNNAATLIEQLKNQNEIEEVEDDIFKIPEWQKEAVRKTVQYAKENPNTLKVWDDIKHKYKL